jgi:REP element-mobilizing transposase RayT
MTKYVDTVQLMERGGYYHIYNRGNNRETIFKETINYPYFLKLWAKYIDPIAETLCYNLLPNHFHFFIRLYAEDEIKQKIASVNNPSRKQLKKLERLLFNPEQHFSDCFNAYAKAINKKYGRIGSLFQKKFKRKRVDDQLYFSILVAYILTNAVKHDLCECVREYTWSSYHNLVEANINNMVLSRFGSREEFIKYIDMYQSHLKIIKMSSDLIQLDL